MTAEHGSKPGMTDYLLATMAKFGARREHDAGVALTSPEQQDRVRQMKFSELAAGIHEMRGSAPGIVRVLFEETGSAIRKRVGKK